MTRRNALRLAPVALVPIAIASPAAASVPRRLDRRIVTVDLGDGQTGTIVIEGGGPGDADYQAPLLRVTTTVSRPGLGDSATVEAVFEDEGPDDDRRKPWTLSPEAHQAGWVKTNTFEDMIVASRLHVPFV